MTAESDIYIDKKKKNKWVDFFCGYEQPQMSHIVLTVCTKGVEIKDFPMKWSGLHRKSEYCIFIFLLLYTVKLDFKNIFGHCHFGSQSQVVLILTVLKANFVDLVISDLVLKPKLVLILTVLKVKFDCT